MSGSNKGNIFDNYVKDTLEILDDHAHEGTQLYPEISDPVTITAINTAYNALTSISEIMSAGDAPGALFDIHWAVVSNISANGDYILRLFEGEAASEVEIATIGIVRNAVQSQEGSVPVQTKRIAAGTRISGALSSSNAASDSVDVKLMFHEY